MNEWNNVKLCYQAAIVVVVLGRSTVEVEHSAVKVDGENASVAGPSMKWVGKRKDWVKQFSPNWKCLRAQNNEKAIIIEIINQKFQFRKFEL